jgi:predicted nucleic acid-binding protein
MMTNKNVFVDTGAWYALADYSDQYHEKAADHIKRLAHDGITITTTNLIIHA